MSTTPTADRPAPSAGPGPARRAPRFTSRGKRARLGTAERGRERFAYWLIAPAVAFMVLVHLLPTAAGMFLSLLNLNTFTFQQLFGAPWAGLDNYDSILFDSANPLHSGFTNAASNTLFYTAVVVAGARP